VRALARLYASCSGLILPRDRAYIARILAGLHRVRRARWIAPLHQSLTVEWRCIRHDPEFDEVCDYFWIYLFRVCVILQVMRWNFATASTSTPLNKRGGQDSAQSSVALSGERVVQAGPTVLSSAPTGPCGIAEVH
jgi:hypothetical protein